MVEKFKKWTIEEQEKNVTREEEQQKWLAEERTKDAEAAEARRAQNREAAKREKENDAKLAEKARQIDALEEELRAQGETEESIAAILDAKAAEEKEKEQEAARERIKALEESLKAEAAQEEAEKAKKEQAETGASPSDDQIVEKKEDAGIQMQSQEEKPEEMQVAVLDDDKNAAAEGTAEAEPEQFDEILAVQHWAMQTPDWKLLNVLIELVDDTQLQYTCKNGDSILEVFANVIQLALWKPYAGPTYMEDGKDEQTAMTQVRGYIMASLLPFLVNKSLPFLSSELTIRYLELFDQAMDIELHLRDSLEDKKLHMEKI